MNKYTQKNWYSKVKNRLHLDTKSSKQKANDIVKEENISHHKFFPFIHFQLKQFKLSKKLEQRENDSAIIDPYKIRDIYYACHSDSYIFSYFNEKLLEDYEQALKENSLDCSIAYRHIDKDKKGSGKSNIDFAAEAFCEMKNRACCYAIGLDIHSFFDELNHEILYKNLCKITNNERLPDDLFTNQNIVFDYLFISSHKPV